MELVIFSDMIGILAFIFAVVGSILIAYGGLSATYRIALRELGRQPSIGYNQIRRDFTSKIVFGLEFFIAADLLTTLIAPTREELLLLAVVVIIRTILGYFLARETEEYPLEP